MLEPLITSAVRLALLRRLYLQPSPENDYPRGLAKILGLSYMPVHRELTRLAEAQVLGITTVGNRRVYQVNPAYPLYRELRQLLQREQEAMSPALQLPPAIIKAIDLFRTQLPKGSSMVLFGSRAEGTARGNSDWDFGFTSAQRLPLQESLRLKAHARALAWPNRIDLVDLTRATPQFRNLALRHAVPV
ncbi:MAG: nucleotidyltransferase domain-containing protein [Deltaproteobacteria bacterium]|nr:nucleotidyltransferase domain-containing protein [Deltaproteobacteria bacterium]